MSKKLPGISLLDILPPNLCEDKHIVASAKAIDAINQQTISKIADSVLIPNIDQLPDDILDVMAWQWHLENFDTSWPETTKRNAIKKSLTWHRKKGTKAIVQDVVDELFAKCLVREWFEYNGKPYMFRLEGSIDDIKSIGQKKSEIIYAINGVKNVRSWLDYIVLFVSTPFKLNSCKRDDVYIPETYKTTWVTETIFKTGLNRSCGTTEKIENKLVQIGHRENIFSGETLNKDLERITLNSSQSYEKCWTTTKTVQTKDKIFQLGGYALNRAGTTQIKRIDAGYDKDISEKQFTRGVTNNGMIRVGSKKQTSHITHRWKTFRTNTTNGRTIVRLNGSQVQGHEETKTKTITTTIKTFAGAVTNGRRLTNESPTTITHRTVHIPVYKDIVQRQGATLLNMVDHTVKKREIKTTIPGKTIKRFSPTKGVILNSHALMGYIKI